MKKYGWEWKTEEGLKSWREILFSIVSAGGTIGNDLQKYVKLADQLIQLENCIPDSFVILTLLGEIYSTAGFLAAKDISLSNELLMKAQKTYEIASKYIVNDHVQDPESVDDFVNKQNLLQYYTTICQIGFAKYVQSNCKDIQCLEEIKPHHLKALSISPDNDVLKLIGGEITKKTGAAQPGVSVRRPEKKDGCFIATAAFGTALAPEILYLQKYRDCVLKMSKCGRKFINIYYVISPPIAKVISKSAALKILTCTLFLRPAIKILRYFFPAQSLK